MKKRSMLAIASLATGFVVAAITPSHGLDANGIGQNVDDTLSTLDGSVVTADSLASAGDALGGASEAKGGKG